MTPEQSGQGIHHAVAPSQPHPSQLAFAWTHVDGSNWVLAGSCVVAPSHESVKWWKRDRGPERFPSHERFVWGVTTVIELIDRVTALG